MFFRNRRKNKEKKFSLEENTKSSVGSKAEKNSIVITEGIYSVIFNENTISEENTHWVINDSGTQELIHNPEKRNQLENGELTYPKFHIYKWIKLDGEYVSKGEPILIIQRGNSEIYKYVFEKAWVSKEILAPESGILKSFYQVEDEVKDNDKLFSILPLLTSEKINYVDNDIYKYLFNFYEIPIELRETINEIWVPSDKRIYIDEWLVKQGDYIEKETPVLRLKCGSSVKTYFEYILKSKTKGYIDIYRYILDTEYPTIRNVIRQNEILYSQIKSNSTRYYNKPLILEDEFEKSKEIKWEVVGGLERPFFVEEYNPIGGFHILFDEGINLFFSFTNLSGQDFITFYFFSSEIKIGKGDTISFLFSNNESIDFKILEKAQKTKLNWNRLFEVKSSISINELKMFSSLNLKKWKITLGSSSYKTMGELVNISYTEIGFSNLLNTFTKEYLSLIQSEISDYRPIEDQEVTNKTTTDKCYVYLMLDTTNQFHKIGISNNPSYREKTLQSEKPTIELLSAKEYPSRKIAESIEKALHNTFREKRIRGEWFELSSIDINEIKETLK